MGKKANKILKLLIKNDSTIYRNTTMDLTCWLGNPFIVFPLECFFELEDNGFIKVSEKSYPAWKYKITKKGIKHVIG